MLTDCPTCQRQFRIYARQLSAAAGMVQCGYCGTQFNALDRLQDEPVQTPQPGLPADPDLPQFEIPGAAGTESETAATAEEDPDDSALDLLPAAPPRRSLLSRILWFSGLLLLLITAALQWLWFNRDELLFRYPQYVPLMQRLCERLQCRLTRDPDPGSIVLVNRDVREHPRFDQVLLINITIENQSDRTRPFPVILLILYDTNGRVIGHRRFTPGQYLDAAVDADAGIMPRQPVHVVLEVTDAGETAVSFEFYFL
jgi:predicted Zn finger-like uncharacterized protein